MFSNRLVIQARFLCRGGSEARWEREEGREGKQLPLWDTSEPGITLFMDTQQLIFLSDPSEGGFSPADLLERFGIPWIRWGRELKCKDVWRQRLSSWGKWQQGRRVSAASASPRRVVLRGQNAWEAKAATRVGTGPAWQTQNPQSEMLKDIRLKPEHTFLPQSYHLCQLAKLNFYVWSHTQKPIHTAARNANPNNPFRW
jgi:hypothetical protein